MTVPGWALKDLEDLGLAECQAFLLSRLARYRFSPHFSLTTIKSAWYFWDSVGAVLRLIARAGCTFRNATAR